jgi:hypothetical protein
MREVTLGVSGDKAHPHAARGDDLYETPAVAVEALLRVEALPLIVWEPACGPGAIARVLRGQGYEVYATDLVDYASSDQDFGGVDFMGQMACPAGARAIVTNPPYRMARAFVEHAVALCPLVIVLARLAFYESTGREAILARCSRIHVFANRLPMMHRAGWAGPKSTSGVAFAWFVWDDRHQGPTTIDRITWREEK